jgi:uncharacterized membrane protein YesL
MSGPRLLVSVITASVRDLYDEMLLLVVANILWSGLSLLVIPLPPALMGMMYLANRLVHGQSVGVRVFFEGFKRYFVKSWQVALLNLVVAIIFGVNIQFYNRFDTLAAQALRILWSYLLVVWVLVQLYVLPVLLEQEEPRVLLALRNATLLAVTNPVFTLLLAVVLVLVSGLCVVLGAPVVLLLAAIVAVVLNRAVLALLAKHRPAGSGGPNVRDTG